MSESVLVTGSSRGIGKAIALELSKSGYQVVIHYLSRQKEAEDLRLKDWEDKFDQEQKLKEEKQILKIEKLIQKEKEQEEHELKDKNEQGLEKDLASKLETFEIKQTKKN